ncbi:pregnancy-specific beta-1-glycoprotein 6-like isoform X2 [Xenia sp. Carnegie-2017]|uniref:pregnancy-specific beta-1-glycoprotein 6-like isoform X2 n=1 Tax=Xenia sp. Carnegie-2017 TaxID=2897299 RepID=UPI001F043080|nr:pregnancy-specific beta-1-glycoprotein 6-like isoform X2 [Xenia sp. Carnegie-2017]
MCILPTEYKMAKFDFLSFVLFWWISTCQGVILSPPPGTSFTFLPGETHNITWTFDDDLNALVRRDWSFTGSNGSQSTLLATLTLDLPLVNFNDPILPNYDVYKPSTLRLRNITHSYDGTYEFQLTRRGSALSPFISKVRVFVARRILSPPPGTSFTFLPGETHNITWRFDDDLNDLVRRDWSFTGSNGSQSTLLATVSLDLPLVNFNDPILPNYDVYKPSTVRLRNITHSYDGTYEFQLTRRGSASSFISKVRVFVAIKPTVVINCSTPLVVSKGDNVSCVCRGEGGNPPAKVTWFDRNNGTGLEFGVKSATLVITGASPNDRGSYRCKAESFNDPRFIDEKSIEIKVNYQPRNTTITLSKINPKIGESVIITCVSDGYPEPTYTIYHNDAVVSNNKTYIIHPINFNHAGSYRCEAKNKLGNDLSHLQNLTVIKVLELSSSISRSRPFLLQRQLLLTTISKVT